MESGPSRNTEATSTILGVVYHRLLAGESPQRASVLWIITPSLLRVLQQADCPRFRSPSSTANFRKILNNSWLRTALPKYLVSIAHILFVAHFIPLLFQFRIGKPSSAGSVFLRWSRAFSPPAHRSTLSSLNLTAKSLKWNFLHMHSNRPLRAHLSLL
jgi:hypothetical protein